MIASLLIANRGEIACRIIRTARRMGIRTIAVCSDADAGALHVRQADAAVHIGPSPAAESYLRGQRIIEAAREAGAEAIHPGYGFLSENAEFAQAVIDAGLIWVGPAPESIRAMGLKDAAKALMLQAGVPVTPGYMGEDQSPARLLKEAEAIGFPVLIKAVAGGGGKGMRKVYAAQQFIEMLESCQREAEAAFGDSRVLLEKWISSPRHIEVQVFGDSHGNVVHLFERDCSLQRRHQKVIEEAPAPGMDAATREAICATAVRAAKAVDYVGAGTIEFIADASEGLHAERIWFMEMNTRLQVEHPVTEEITGVDLVEWQLRVASGEKLPLKQKELGINGHAIEARLYAEDPSRGFLPNTGKLRHFQLPAPDADSSRRIETGVEEGDGISPFYDPMIAKLISRGATRQDAIDTLKDMTGQTMCWPVRSNAGFLHRLLGNADFEAGDVDTGLIERHLEELVPDPIASQGALQSVAQAIVESFGGSPALTGFRLNRSPAPALLELSDGEQEYSVAFSGQPAGELPTVTKVPEGYLVVEAGVTRIFSQSRADSGGEVAIADGAIVSPMPGKVISIDVSQGMEVAKGQRLMVIEAMKMEHSLTAPFDGRVAELTVTDGAQVQVEQVLARIEKLPA